MEQTGIFSLFFINVSLRKNVLNQLFHGIWARLFLAPSPPVVLSVIIRFFELFLDVGSENSVSLYTFPADIIQTGFRSRRTKLQEKSELRTTERTELPRFFKEFIFTYIIYLASFLK